MKTTDFKTADVLNRRQQERPLNLGLHDISCARYFTIGESSTRYKLKSRSYTNDYAVYTAGEYVECIGYAEPDRNKIVISVRRHGLDWNCRVPLSEIKIYGNKTPSE